MFLKYSVSVFIPEQYFFFSLIYMVCFSGMGCYHMKRSEKKISVKNLNIEWEMSRLVNWNQ